MAKRGGLVMGLPPLLAKDYRRHCYRTIACFLAFAAAGAAIGLIGLIVAGFIHQ